MKKKVVSELAKQASKIKVTINKNLDLNSSIKDAPFFKEKTKRAEEIISQIGLPK